MSPGSRAVAGVVLAAGLSRRFGGPKVLAPWRGKPLVQWVVEAAMASSLKPIAIVTGHEGGRVRAALADQVGPKLVFVDNPDYADGQASSVVAGLAAICDDHDAAMFLMADQPLLTAGVIDALIEAWRQSGGGICHPRYRGERRNPVVFARRYFSEILALSGDEGARRIIDSHPEAVSAVDFEDGLPFLDIDRPEDMDLLRSADGAKE